jgi:molybdenum cofactor cytidylyltransferase
VVVPTIDGKRGNPVVWSRRFFPDLMTLEGDVGARHLIASCADAVAEVPLEDSAALTDVDTPDALMAVKAELERMMALSRPPCLLSAHSHPLAPEVTQHP